jgi:hypothetical protein
LSPSCPGGQKIPHICLLKRQTIKPPSSGEKDMALAAPLAQQVPAGPSLPKNSNLGLPSRLTACSSSSTKQLSAQCRISPVLLTAVPCGMLCTTCATHVLALRKCCSGHFTISPTLVPHTATATAHHAASASPQVYCFTFQSQPCLISQPTHAFLRHSPTCALHSTRQIARASCTQTAA